MRIIAELIVRMALENPRWGYTRIQGALYNLGHEVGRGTIANVLKREGIEPAPERGGRTPWSVFLKAHWRSIVAADFFTAEVWSLARVGDLLRAFHHRAGQARRSHRWHHNAAQRRLDDASRTQLD